MKASSTSPTAEPSQSLPLEGLVVVAVEQAVAVPLASRQLADLGARVVKVERPGSGDFARHYDHSVSGVSAYFAWLNRGKESVTIDLKDPTGLRTARRLAGQADVFLQNLAPGAAKRMGLDGRTLHRRHESLIGCDLTGYGPGGLYGGRKAYDLLIQAEAGLLSVTGTPGTPSKAGISVADIAGGMYLFSSVLAALYERERVGRGTHIEVSLFDCLAEWMSQPWYLARYAGSPPPRSGARHASIAPYGPFQTADGSIVIGLQNEREWGAFCTSVIGSAALASDPRFSSNARRVEHSADLDRLIEGVLGGLPTAEVEEHLEAAGIAHGVLRSPADLTGHPQMVSRERWRTVDGPEGPIEAMLPPFLLGGRQPLMGDVPMLGEHTEDVMAWLDATGGDNDG